jgi:ribose 5-phosphate isomerase RpiB
MKMKIITILSFTPEEIKEIVLDHLKNKGFDVSLYTSDFKMEDYYNTYSEAYETEFKGLEIKIEETK